MLPERIAVIAYAGRKSDERPTTFVLRALRIDVMEIIEQWIEEGFEDIQRVQKRYFRLRGSDGNVHCIYYDENIQEWYYESQHAKK